VVLRLSAVVSAFMFCLFVIQFLTLCIVCFHIMISSHGGGVIGCKSCVQYCILYTIMLFFFISTAYYSVCLI